MARLGGDEAVLEAIRRSAVRLEGALRDHDRLLEEVGDARFVLIGDGTHGTDDFYRERALITRRLIAEKGFGAVAVEADWPDAYRANRFVRGLSSDRSGEEALRGFLRFPTWMWRNGAVVEFLEWLREYNDAHHEPWSAVGFYGLDLYSLSASMTEVVTYLQTRNPEAARRARQRYACFDRINGGDAQTYGYLAAGSPDLSCEKEVVEQLVELLEARGDYAAEDEALAEDEFFFAEQNARLARNAEEYYRLMYRGGVSSWNLRDKHMAQTLEALGAHLSQRGDGDTKFVIWAHNSHLGDARATTMGRAGEWNLGQLVREEHGREAFLLGFTTHEGHVTAASDWDGEPERKRVRPALPGSYEALFHAAGLERFFLSLREPGEALGALGEERLERMIGVIYRSRTERQSHYFHCDLLRQFDAVVHLDTTSALVPLESTQTWIAGEAPETYPSGF